MSERFPIKYDEDALQDALRAVEKEVRAAIRQWPMPARDPLQHLAIIIEEVGEAARPLNDRWNSDREDWREEFHKEMVQAAAMCVRALMEVPLVTIVTREGE